MPLRAILFDAGGTLFRVRGSVGEVYATIAARHGVTAAASDIESRFRVAFRGMPPLAFPGVTDSELPRYEYVWWRELVAAAFAGSRFTDFEAFFRELFDYFAEADGWELFADTQPALAMLKTRGLRLAVVSNFDGRLVRILQGLGIADAFEAIVMSGRVGYAKPDARIFVAALSRLGVVATEALHVGDSEREDLIGARSAGLQAILIQREALADRADCVRDLREL